jgi:hypothetical protein
MTGSLEMVDGVCHLACSDNLATVYTEGNLFARGNLRLGKMMARATVEKSCQETGSLKHKHWNQVHCQKAPLVPFHHPVTFAHGEAHCRESLHPFEAISVGHPGK